MLSANSKVVASRQVPADRGPGRDDAGEGVGAYATPGGAETGRYEYVEYECDDDIFAFEKYDDEPWRSCTGRWLPLSAVEVLS